MKVLIYFKKPTEEDDTLDNIIVKKYTKETIKEVIGKTWEIDHRIINIK